MPTPRTLALIRELESELTRLLPQALEAARTLPQAPISDPYDTIAIVYPDAESADAEISIGMRYRVATRRSPAAGGTNASADRMADWNPRKSPIHVGLRTLGLDVKRYSELCDALTRVTLQPAEFTDEPALESSAFAFLDRVRVASLSAAKQWNSRLSEGDSAHDALSNACIAYAVSRHGHGLDQDLRESMDERLLRALVDGGSLPEQFSGR